MSPVRLATLVVASLTIPLAYRLGGTSLWLVMALGLGVSSALAAYELQRDGLLRRVFVPKGLDASTGVLAAFGLFTLVVLVWNFVIAPPIASFGLPLRDASSSLDLMRKCTLNGVAIPRPTQGTVAAILDFARTQTCRGYAVSLGLTGATRGAATLVIAALEEISWRGGIQQGLSEKFGSTRGWLATTVLYAAVHALTGNWMTALLALLGGFTWGALYRYRGRLAPGITSHLAFSYFLFYARPLVWF